ncbi:S41 family peptidase [Candidatus Daviesbacteria bacterium]|nr:S41 family peptidase [Candidatus Daviesbacteria bacterium]
MKNFFLRINLRIVLIVILTFVIGWKLGQVDNDPPKNINVDFKLFWDTWNLLSRDYLERETLDTDKLFYGAISGMVSAAGDPYTFFLPPEVQKASKEELGGTFEGVGIQLGFNEEKKLVVIAPLSGMPAEKAGIKPGDWIIKIDNTDTAGMTLAEAVKLIRGEKGTKVELVIAREEEEETRTFTLIRDTILVKSVELKYKKTKSGKNVAVLKLSRFSERTRSEWTEAVSDILSKRPQGIILDVRNNPGGYLDGAVFVSSEFLDGGDVVLQEDGQGRKQAFKVNRKGQLFDLSLIVLINKGSASASEIVAGALQDRGRAKVVGEKSFGKGTIQETQDLPKGTGIHITVAKWLTPNGRWVNETQGLEPDVKIEGDKEDSTKDPQLDKALELLE